MSNIKDLLREALEEGDRRELFEYLLEADEITTAARETIRRREDRQTAPLSFAQQRLWFLEQMEPGSPAYNIAGALHLRGEIDPAALGCSLNEILLRHEALRTSFTDSDGNPVQVINPPATISLPLIDLSELPGDKRAAAARKLCRGEAGRGFDISKAPLLRVKLLRLAQNEHMMVVCMHHIISDGWSISVLIREMAELYSAFSNGQRSPLPELLIQYADFAAWQREWLQGETLETLLAYWKTQLGGDLPVLSLPTDRPRPAVQSYRGASAKLCLGKPLSEQLQELSRQSGATLFMTLMAAFDLLLYRYTGQEEITVGTVIASRNRRETEGLIGFFANTLVMKVDLSRELSFQQTLQRVKQTALAAYEHQDLPFEKLVEALRPGRNLSHSALFQVMFTLQGDWLPVIELPGVTMTPLEIESENSKFDLALEMDEGRDGLSARLEYNTDLFDKTTIERMLRHFEVLLATIVANPDQMIATLPILTPPEQEQLIVEWNQTSKELPTDKCIHQLFEEQVRRTPDSTAFVYERQSMSYAELNRRANQVARALGRAGVGPDVTVGICMERGVEMIVGLMGILKAGGAYVPLDPAYPADRLRFMLADSGARALIVEAQFARPFADFDVPLICLDTGWSEIAKESEQDLVNQLTLDNLVYIIYTSGSTGVPKGVLVPHGGVLNCLLWLQEALQLNQTDRVLCKSPLSFDASVWELFGPLMVGACVVVARPGGHQDSFYMAELLSSEKVTLAHFVPSMLSLFLEEEGIDHLDSLRRVVCGGEALAPEALQRAFNRLGAEIHNFYGPTETSIGSIDSTCEPRDTQWVVPIGRPIANTEIYILNDRLQPVPVGVAGELYTGGAGLARGYLKRPELTAARFVPDPFGPSAGARLYQSGDLARYRADGRIEFLGRLDQQVKVRGFRIELGEIETVLAQHPAVRESVVLAREDVPGGKRLVAYVVQADGAEVSTADLRNFLREKLPDYMVPSAFVVIDEIPLTSNGKLDRRALPAPDAGMLAVEGGGTAPRRPLEELLSGIWTEVLGVDGIGIHDNFFDLGGHSLLATQVTSRIRATVFKDISVRRLFERPTIAMLAEFIEAQMNSSQALETVALVPSSRDQRLPLSFAQQRLWFLDQLESNKSVYNMGAMQRMEGRLELAALERALGEMVRRHEILRTTFARSGDEPVQIINPAAPVRLPLIDLSDQPEGARMDCLQKLATREAQRSFDLSRGPLLRAMRVRLAEDDHVLLLILHHIVWDGWSVGVLTRELATLYKAFVNGEESPLPELEIQYADFTRWQRQWLNSDLLESQLAYWKRQLEGSTQALELPADYARPPVQSYRGATFNFVLSPELLQQIKALSRREGTTLFMTLLAAFQALLYRYTGQADISVGSPVANRNLPALEGLIGFFVNTLVMRVSFAGDPTFSDVLARVREVAFGAYAHQDLPFEMLVEQLQPTRDLSHSPLFQVMFALQNAPHQPLELEGLKLSHIELDTGMSHFDLTLSMVEEAEGLIGSLEYNTDLFAAATIARLAAHLELLLKQVVVVPNRPIADLTILTETERHALLVEWNNPLADPLDQPCLNDLFEQQAARTPDQTAVEFEGEHLSYRELNARANQLADYLRELGAGPDILIGICLPRRVDMISGLLAILKSGAAFVPLDPGYPKPRLAFMLEGVHLVLTQRPLLEAFASSDVKLVCLDSEMAELAGRSTENPAGHATSESLAYVVYTSGSTGRPKGVAMSHGAASSMTRWQVESSQAAVGTRTLQFTSLSFDVSFQEIFSTLSSGGTVVLISEETRRDDEKLMRFLRESSIDRLFVPFVMLRQLGERAETCEALPTSLQEVMTAGEQLKITPEIEALFSKLPHCLLYNHYGPSETHAATSFTLSGPARDWPRIPSIGYPIHRAQVYVLDQRLQPVPVGVSGELYIGGAGLARGYLKRPELTAARFVPDPFGPSAGARLYQSGDLARYRADGRIEFLGRLDQQVKVRGFRIELGEIETVLKRHENVREAVAVAWEPKPGQKRLAAYVVLDSRADVSIAELRAHLKESLPEYMQPSVFIKLTELPLTASGKVNHRALPSPDSATLESRGDHVAPRNPIEEVVATIWAEVLEVERISVADNFFDLGGHSLLATRLVARLQEVFNVEVPLRRLFEYPTVESLAECIAEALQVGLHLDALPLEQVSRDERLPLSFAQQRLWFLSYVDPGNTAYNMPAALRMEGAIDLQALADSFAEIITRHEVLRTSFTAVEGTPVQIINPPADFHLPLVDLTELPRAQREIAARALAVEEARQPFDLTRLPLLRVKLLRLGEQDHVLLVTMHHIVSDGWSIGIMIRELAAIYQARIRGERPPLAELALQYADFAVWQRAWLKGEVLDRQLDYWKQQLERETPVLLLPTDRPRPAVQTFQGTSLTFSIPRAVSDQLKDFARREGATLFMSLLAAFQILLHRYSGQHDITVGTPIANRSRRELEGLIGFFVNTLVMRTDLRTTLTYRDLIRHVREITLGGYTHQDIPFEKLVEELHPERDLSHSPLFQVALALQNAPIPRLELFGLVLRPLETESLTTKFDLVFSLEEKEQELRGVAEYNTDLFDRTTIERMTGHFRVLLEASAANPDQRIDRLQMLTQAEQRQLLEEWNQTAAAYPAHKCIHHLFEEQVERTPDAVAVIFNGERTTYRGLNHQANQLARHLSSLGIGRGATVGVYLDRSLDMVVGVLGIIKAGAAYVPIEAAWPQARILAVLSSLDISCMLTQYAQLRVMHDLQWQLPRLANVICLDVETEQPAAEPIDREVVQGLWDRVAEAATDRISAGGFTSSYTGEAFSEAEVDQYVSRVTKLAEPFIGSQKRVLEIGCGAGIIMFELASKVGQYVGLDPSAVTQERNRRSIADAGISNIELVTGFAHETGAMPASSFDLVVIASAAQFFPGPLYFRQVIAEALRLLVPGGRILLCDILDARRKEEFRQSLVEFQSNHPEAKTKTDIDRELYCDEDYFYDLEAKHAQIAHVEVMERGNRYANELGFRYDVLLEKADSKIGPAEAPNRAEQKKLWTRWHVRQFADENPHKRLTSADLAYLIFTSGSTGAPKGIVVNHQAVVNLIDWVNKTYRVGAGDELLFVTSLAFDLSVYDLFGILAAGATIHVASGADLRDPGRLVEKLCNEGITFWDSAPAALQQLAPLFPTGDSAHRKHRLRLVFLSGDWIPLSLPGQLRAAFAGAQVISLGGATEATIWSNSYPVDDIKPEWASIPYGKPIQNARYYIFDDNENLCPVGVPGQLYIGGDCLALGYTDPALTAERFVPAPLGDRAGARLYKTGDRARWWPDGNIEFLGRIDHQVKVRGFRIELGEIESALAKHPAVRESLVIARADATGHKRLVAYVTLRQGQTAAINELRRFLKQKLPDYMVPSAFIFLASMPLTRNGKVDREKLPDPRSAGMDMGASFVAPASELEKAIAAIWQETLGVERVSAYDNFFDIGGHSLLMIQVYTRLRELLRGDLSIIDLFKYPTISSLAEYLGQEKAASSKRSEQDRGQARRQSIASRARSRDERPSDRRHGRT